VTGNRFPRKCACGCGLGIPRDPEVRYVVNFGAPRPYPAYLREHSPDYGSYRGGRVRKAEEDASPVPSFRPASEILREMQTSRDVAHEDVETAASPQAGRPWASGQLVFNAGQFESARSGFADYAKDGETPAQLRIRVNRVILEDLEQKVLALRALHSKLRDIDGGEAFGDVVSRSRPRSEMLWKRCRQRPRARLQAPAALTDERDSETGRNAFLRIAEGFSVAVSHSDSPE
jgi:hypothetical protein